MKKQIIMTAIICAVVLAAASILSGFWDVTQSPGVLKVGFVYSEDESTPYTANFVKAQRALEDEYGSKVEILARSNVLSREGLFRILSGIPILPMSCIWAAHSISWHCFLSSP